MAMRYTAVEMFAGAGGAALGLKEAGFHSLASIEMWDVAVKTLAVAGFPVVAGRVEDRRVVAEVVRRVRITQRPLDFLWASPPCQPYSSSGLRLGKVDDRDGWGATLMYVMKLRPRAVVIENVADAPVDDWAKAIAGEGHFAHASTFDLKSTQFGVAQDRPRSFVYAGPAPLSEFLAEVRKHEQPKVGLDDVLPYLKGFYVRSEQTTARARSAAEPCPTFNTKGNVYIHKIDMGVRATGYKTNREISRRMTPEEQKVVHGFPADYPIQGKVEDRFRLVGNSVSPPLARALGLAVSAVLDKYGRAATRRAPATRAATRVTRGTEGNRNV